MEFFWRLINFFIELGQRLSPSQPPKPEKPEPPAISYIQPGDAGKNIPGYHAE